jgi:hypothetical protein
MLPKELRQRRVELLDDPMPLPGRSIPWRHLKVLNIIARQFGAIPGPYIGQNPGEPTILVDVAHFPSECDVAARGP